MRSNLFTQRWSIPAFALVCTFLWGSAYPVVKICVEAFGIDPGDIPSKILLAGVRFLIAGVVMLGFARGTGRSILPPSVSCLPYLIAIAFFNTILQYSFNYVGIANTAAAKSAILSQVGTFILVLCTGLFYRDEKINGKKAVGSALGFIGVAVVNLSGFGPLPFTLTGEGFVLLGSVMAAAGLLVGRKAARAMDAVLLTAYQQLLGGLVLLSMGGMLGGRLSAWTVQGIISLAYLVIVSTVAYSLWMFLQKYHNVAEISMYRFGIPLFGTLASGILLGEAIWNLPNLISLLLVCVGIVIVNVRLWPKTVRRISPEA